MTHSHLRSRDLITASLLHTYGCSESLLEKLSVEEKTPLKNSMNLLSGGDKFQLNVAIEHIHFSWLVPLLEKMSKPLQLVFGNSLTEENRKGLKLYLEIPVNTQKTPHSILRKFLLTYLETHLRPKEVRPLYLIAHSELKALITTESRRLHRWIHYLGLKDLAYEIPNLIDKEVLKNIYSFLKPKEKQYVKKIMHQSNFLGLPPLNLQYWNGDKLELLSLVHKRGLKRFSHALQGESSDFMWHLTHHFDIGRGKVIENLCARPIEDKKAEKLKEDLHKIMKSV